MYVWENKIDNISFITLNNHCGLEVVLSTLGASIYDLKYINKNNELESVVIYPSELKDFYENDGYHGKTVGRFSGRIDKGLCQINGINYPLDINWNEVSSLHGGFDGISFQNFDYQVIDNIESVDVIFTYFEKENKLPGDVNYQITYQVMKDKNEINLILEANTNKDTLVNLTNHVYFNLSGDGKNNVLDQELELSCDRYTNLNNELITLSIDEVNEVMDFRLSHPIGDYIYDEKLQNHTAKGYDHCWFKTDTQKDLIAKLTDLKSGRKLNVYTSYDAIVCYAGCYPKDFPFNKDRIKIGQYHSICLECQNVPNGINMENVNKSILKAGDKYRHYIRYQFELI